MHCASVGFIVHVWGVLCICGVYWASVGCIVHLWGCIGHVWGCIVHGIIPSSMVSCLMAASIASSSATVSVAISPSSRAVCFCSVEEILHVAINKVGMGR